MDKRVVLGGLIRAMLALLVLAFIFVLFRSLSGPSLTSSPNAVFDNVVIGQTALRRLARERVWVTRLSSAQVRQAGELNAVVVDALVGCRPSAVLCVLSAKSSRSGIDLVYVATPPAQLPSDTLWYGGFVDPATGGVFDFLGRAYKAVGSSDERSSLALVDISGW